jgi:hypothetical protein
MDESYAYFNKAAESAKGDRFVQAGVSGRFLLHPKKTTIPTTTNTKNNFFITDAIIMQ